MLHDLHTQLRAARRDLVMRLAEDMDPERHLPDAGLLALLADIHGALAAIEEEAREP
jgi:hypothetical protein